MEFKAIYSDGTEYQWDEDVPNGNGYGKIDRSKMVKFELNDKKTGLVHRLHLEPGQRLIARRRTVANQDGSPREIIYIVGYQETIETVNGLLNRQAVMAIFGSDGHTELIGSWKNAPLDAINLMDIEVTEEERVEREKRREQDMIMQVEAAKPFVVAEGDV